MSQFLLDLQRMRVPELMDDPAIERAEHERALRSLRLLNLLSRTAHQMLSPVVALAKRLGRSELSLLDVACGGGDVPIRLARLAESRGIRLRLKLVDRSGTALERALHTARSAGVECQVAHGDALDDDLPKADVVTNSLFLHHLDREDVGRALRSMWNSAGHLLLVSDLRRCRMGYVLAWTTVRLFSRSPVVHFDGPASVRAAWRLPELKEIAREAGLNDVTISKTWPLRMLLTCTREAG